MASTALSWQDRHPTQRFSLPSSNDIRYRAEHRGPSSSSSEANFLSCDRACVSPTVLIGHKGMLINTISIRDVGSDSDAEDGEDGFDVSMDIDENESSSVAAAHSKLNTRIPLAPLDTLPITGKRKHEDPHAIIPPPTPHENRDKSMMIYDSNDLPDYEFVMGDDEADMEPSRDVLSGLYESDTMRLIIICSVCGRRSCSIPHASLGRLELLNGCEIEEARMGDSPRNESPQFKVPAPTRSAKVRTASLFGLASPTTLGLRPLLLPDRTTAIDG
ncbi:uncharacterized protein PHACADRAFT_206662 [Phanerochaete carnosa HHB-10118-sp]|uniref:Uncharacterized protein n=1 Tax=Phanerochaete carnosa (strain HHB-10118-sp) TaxID=650164 RepID=K5X4P5_PHACS|nr:uncharacterized protein PHACADRAFT_206662 [Phanerochaete carnosa HHB-10118-sp]EKM57787.1 hypothetical protein PHACADRAFT_206662 [Phanerochaete carnosa HHB-10118-sp]